MAPKGRRRGFDKRKGSQGESPKTSLGKGIKTAIQGPSRGFGKKIGLVELMKKGGFEARTPIPGARKREKRKKEEEVGVIDRRRGLKGTCLLQKRGGKVILAERKEKTHPVHTERICSG